ncbi:MAG TPA: hypothetical protein VK277_07950 [Acidimicrobiales bacterium]|nr:hypothetical protein [Acidimicrobiales bacterium]
MSGPSALRVAVVYPDLLGTYGDGGNGLILSRRAQWRGYPVELVQALSDEALPTADLYCLGGGEDGPQVRAAEGLLAEPTLTRAVEHGAVVLAVCAGYQIVGRSFPDADGTRREGVGLLDADTVKGAPPRAVGEVLAEPTRLPGTSEPLPTLTGFENHAGRTRLGEGVTPLARLVLGRGNESPAGTEGAVAGRVVGTYLHGPVLARNPALADLLLAWALAVDGLAPLDDHWEEALRYERLHMARRSRRLVARLGRS